MNKLIQRILSAVLFSMLTGSAFAQGTAFTYQGRLNDGDSPASGSYDLRFALFDAFTLGNQIGLPLTNSPVNLSNGLFTVMLDFGNQFPGADRWLEIGVRTNGGSAFTSLNPRQPLTPAPYSIYAGSAATLATTNQPLNLTINGANALRISSVFDANYQSFTVNSAGGYSGNVVSNGSYGTFIGGGGNSFGPNRVGANYASVLGGLGNTADGNFSTAMGQSTRADGSSSTAMGFATKATGDSSIAAGVSTTASGNYSTATGNSTTASGDSSSSMGYHTTASGHFSIAMGNGTIASGESSIATGDNCKATNYAATAMGVNSSSGGFATTAMGNQAKALHDGSFVWGDATFTNIASTSQNSVTMRASGGYRLFSNGGASLGVSLFPNSTSWSAISDRNAKKNIQPVDSREVLEKLTHVPVERWNYKSEPDDSVPHIGPMAQDFKAAFYPGRDDKSITTLEFDGVALAAIQGLNEKVESGKKKAETRIERLERENAELKQRLEALEKTIRHQKS